MSSINATSNDTFLFNTLKEIINKTLDQICQINDIGCVTWDLPNHFLFQIANILVFFSYLAPPTIGGLFFFRFFLLLGCIFYSCWSWFVFCSYDMFIWNGIFIVLNFVHLVILFYFYKFFKFSPLIEKAYKKIFYPLNVSRRDFEKIYKCRSEILKLKVGETYCIENVTQVEKLSLVLCGRLSVSQKGLSLHIVDALHFLDSPEWFGMCTADSYQVTITAVEDSQLLVWNRDKLKLSISANKYLNTVLDNVLGKDVVKKLMLVTEASHHSQPIAGVEETSLLLPKAPLGQSGMDVLLSRHIGNCHHFNIWNLSRQIKEKSQKNDC